MSCCLPCRLTSGASRQQLEVLLLQFLSLMSSGERKNVKTCREFVTMDDLIDEAGKDAARAFLLMRNIESLEFDLAWRKKSRRQTCLLHSVPTPEYAASSGRQRSEA